MLHPCQQPGAGPVYPSYMGQSPGDGDWPCLNQDGMSFDFGGSSSTGIPPDPSSLLSNQPEVDFSQFLHYPYSDPYSVNEPAAPVPVPSCPSSFFSPLPTSPSFSTFSSSLPTPPLYPGSASDGTNRLNEEATTERLLSQFMFNVPQLGPTPNDTESRTKVIKAWKYMIRIGAVYFAWCRWAHWLPKCPRCGRFITMTEDGIHSLIPGMVIPYGGTQNSSENPQEMSRKWFYAVVREKKGVLDPCPGSILPIPKGDLPGCSSTVDKQARGLSIGRYRLKGMNAKGTYRNQIWFQKYHECIKQCAEAVPDDRWDLFVDFKKTIRVMEIPSVVPDAIKAKMEVLRTQILSKVEATPRLRTKIISKDEATPLDQCDDDNLQPGELDVTKSVEEVTPVIRFTAQMQEDFESMSEQGPKRYDVKPPRKRNPIGTRRHHPAEIGRNVRRKLASSAAGTSSLSGSGDTTVSGLSSPSSHGTEPQLSSTLAALRVIAIHFESRPEEAEQALNRLRLGLQPVLEQTAQDLYDLPFSLSSTMTKPDTRRGGVVASWDTVDIRMKAETFKDYISDDSVVVSKAIVARFLPILAHHSRVTGLECSGLDHEPLESLLSTLSIDETEGPELIERRIQSYMRMFNRSDTPEYEARVSSRGDKLAIQVLEHGYTTEAWLCNSVDIDALYRISKWWNDYLAEGMLETKGSTGDSLIRTQTFVMSILDQCDLDDDLSKVSAMVRMIGRFCTLPVRYSGGDIMSLEGGTGKAVLAGLTELILSILLLDAQGDTSPEDAEILLDTLLDLDRPAMEATISLILAQLADVGCIATCPLLPSLERMLETRLDKHMAFYDA